MKKTIKINWFLVCVVVVAAVLSVVLFLNLKNNPYAHPNDPINYQILGSNLAKYHVYAENKDSEGNWILTAYRPPGLPIFLAIIYSISGKWQLAVLSQIGLFLISIIMFFSIVKRFFSDRVAQLVIVIYLLNPVIYFMNNSLWTESISQFFIIGAFYFYFLGRERKNPLLVIISGLLFGWLILTRPTYLIYLLIIPLVFIYHFFKFHKFEYLKFILIFFAILPVLFWSIRSSIATGGPVLVSTNGGVNMLLGNNPYVLNGNNAAFPPTGYLVSGNVVKTDNEYLSDKNYKKLADHWIAKNPLKFAKLAFSKIRNLFLPNSYVYNEVYNVGNLGFFGQYFWRLMIEIYFFLILFLALLGILFLKNKWHLWWLVPYIFMIVLSFVDGRFFVPLYLPISILAALAILNYQKIAAYRCYLIIVISAMVVQFCYYLPQFEGDLSLASDYFSKIIDQKSSPKSPDDVFVTDAFDHSNEQKIIVKKHKIGEEENQFFIDSSGTVASQDYLVNLIKAQQLHTDLLTIFSNLDKKIYPDLNVDNYLLEYKFNKAKPIFEITSTKNLTSMKILAKNVYSDQPNEKVLAFHSIISDNSICLLNFNLESKSKIKIVSGQQKFILTNYLQLNPGELKVAFSQLAGSEVKIYLENNFPFTSHKNYNIFTGSKKGFDANNARINFLGCEYKGNK